jgi:outer membrane protein TolC
VPGGHACRRQAFEQLRVGAIDFNQYAVIQQNLIQQQDLWAQARGEIAFGLIQVYRALGGGWEIRLHEPTAEEVEPPEEVPPPAAERDEPAN